MFPWKNHLSSIVSGRFFSQNALLQADEYARGGRVLVERIEQPVENQLEIDATVQGHVRRPYSVNITIEKTSNARYDVDGECTCPMSHNCKHVAATILAAARNGTFDQQKDDIATNLGNLLDLEGTHKLPRNNPDLTAQPPPVLLSYDLNEWLSRLQPREKILPAPPSPVKRLIFVLSREASYGRPHRCQITLMRQVIKKSGQPGKATRVSTFGAPRDFLAEPAASEFGDLLRTMFGQYGFTADMQIEGAFGATLLERLLLTGRLFWQRPTDEPLRLGEPRPAQPIWRQFPNGSQQATFETEPPTDLFLPLSPPWYLDPTAGICGPLRVEGDPALAERWIGAPVVPPEQARLVADSLRTLPVPAPRPIGILVRKPVKPTPILRLEKVHFAKPARKRRENSWYDDPVSSLDVARVFFDYDGIRIPQTEKNQFASRLTDAGLERIPRMPRIEAQRMTEVATSGLYSINEVLNYPIPDDVNQAWSMLSAAEWMEFVTTMVPGAQSVGWTVEIAPDFSFRPAEIEGWYSETESSGEDWFGYELGILVEGQRISLLPALGNILRLLDQNDRAGQPIDIVHWKLDDGRIVPLPAERLRAIAATLAELFDPDALSNGKLQVSRLRAAELIDLQDDVTWRGPAELQQLRQQLRSFDCIRPVAPPSSLAATLRPYQRDGLSWLQFLREHNFSGILADDMGLGKTVQAIAHILAEKEAGRATAPSLVIAPTSLMPNWRAEAEKFAPSLKTLVLHGGGRKARFDEIPTHDLVITSYALLTKDREILEKQNFHLLLLDEAQYIKNAKTQWAEICRALNSNHRLCMTGTPMENHLGELWSLMHFLSPGYLGSEKQFRRIYRDPIEKSQDAARRSALARRIRPFIMRRRKEEVAADLPEKTEIVRNVELDGKQRDLYETIRIAMHERVRAEVEKKGLARSHIVILDALLKLRQVCCDPRIVKLERAKSVKESAKLDLLTEMLPEMISEGRRVLLFSQFTSMLDLLEPALNKLKIPFVRLDGSTADRETPVKTFQSGKVPLFLISLKAGGTGLNLTAADTVIHYDPWWNPAVERQATDRAHRIGQDKKVFVYKLVTTGTVEEKILAMQERKKELVAGLLGEGAQENLQLSKEDLDHLFDPLA
ncbi:MAG: DEAD/DEAH box helicase [Phycisphaerae bacterium]